MNEEMMLRGAEPRKILETVIEEKVPAIMSYLSKRKWHVAKVTLSGLGASRLEVTVSIGKKPQPVNIRVDQPVGISIKHGYGKFVFESKVIALEPPSDPESGGTIVLMVPSKIQTVQRRSYFRVKVPSSLKVNTVLWHRSRGASDSSQAPSRYFQGSIVDISAGGAQLAVNAAENPDFKKGQFISFRFTPMPYEKPILLSAQIRNVLPTVDGKSFCLGLQIVGLEASEEGRQTLFRLCSVVENYYRMQQEKNAVERSESIS